MTYCHTQHAPLKLLLYATAAAVALAAWVARSEPVLAVVLATVACLAMVLALSFHWLTIADEGHRLSIRYGPLPLFTTSIDYASISRVEAGRSSIIDGWGIHYLPGRGWTYNLWGTRCAILHVGRKVIRIGTDDLDNLVAFLERKLDLSDDPNRRQSVSS